MDENSILEAAAALARGEAIIVTDDMDRENEGDLVLAAEKATDAAIAFMIRHTGGVICTPLTAERLEELGLPMMTSHNTDRNQTAFTVSVDYLHGTSTGVSAQDRCKTIRALADPSAKPSDFSRPGHVFPLRYREGGVLKRAGHTEASIDLMRIAGLKPAAAISEIVNEDGSVARRDDLLRFAKKYDLQVVSVADLVRYRRKREKLIRLNAEATLPTSYGDFHAYVYESLIDGMEHIAIVKGTLNPHQPTLVRVHSECLTGDVFDSRRCDCGSQLHSAMKRIAQEGSGVIVYLRGHEGRGIGLGHKLRAYKLQEAGCDTVEANEQLGLPVDSREYGIGAQILSDLGVKSLRLMTNNLSKYGGIEGYDLEIVERVPLTTAPHKDNLRYLLAKQEKLGHLLDISIEETAHAGI